MHKISSTTILRLERRPNRNLMVSLTIVYCVCVCPSLTKYFNTNKPMRLKQGCQMKSGGNQYTNRTETQTHTHTSTPESIDILSAYMHTVHTQLTQHTHMPNFRFQNYTFESKLCGILIKFICTALSEIEMAVSNNSFTLTIN